MATIYKYKRPAEQLRQSDNTYNMAFFHQTAIKNKESFEGFSPNSLFFLGISAAYLEHQSKKAQRKNLVQVTY